MTTGPQSLDEKLATYDWIIQQTPKYALLAHKMYNVQTHFGFTNLGSKVNTFWVLGNWKVKKVSGTPCTLLFDSSSKSFEGALEKHYALETFKMWS